MLRPLVLSFAGLFALGLTVHSKSQDPVVLGAGAHTYRWVTGWGALPEGMTLGNTHGCIVVDSEDRVYVNTDTENAVIVFGPDGSYLRSFGKELAGNPHGMLLRREGDEEFIYMAHTSRQEVLKLNLEGEILWTLPYPKESGLYDDPGRYRPTSVAIAPNGDLYVADGYGLSWIHVFDKERKYKRSIGGHGGLRGQFKTCHGIAIEEWEGEPALMVADRENNRVQVLGLDGSVLSVMHGNLRRPCHVHYQAGEILVPDLAGRVTILDEAGDVVVHLGDQPRRGQARAQRRGEGALARRRVPLTLTVRAGIRRATSTSWTGTNTGASRSSSASESEVHARLPGALDGRPGAAG